MLAGDFDFFSWISVVGIYWRLFVNVVVARVQQHAWI